MQWLVVTLLRATFLILVILVILAIILVILLIALIPLTLLAKNSVVPSVSERDSAYGKTEKRVLVTVLS